MPVNPNSSNILRGPIPEIAEKVWKRRNDLGFSANRLADECTESVFVLSQLFPERNYEEFNNFDSAKILHLEMARRSLQGAGIPKTVPIEEIEIMAYALRVPPDYLMGHRNSRNPIIWDPLFDSDQTEHIKTLMKTYEEKTGEFIGWAEFLPCSYETKEFMECHHEAMFAKLPQKSRSLVVNKFNEIGNSRRLRLLRPNRSYSFALLICLSDLRKIAIGDDEYQFISAEMRRECFRNLGRILSDASLNLNMIVAEDEEVRQLMELVRDTDGIIVMGDEYTQWRLHRGDILWSEHPALIKKHREFIEEFCQQAAYRTLSDVIGLINKLEASVK